MSGFIFFTNSFCSFHYKSGVWHQQSREAGHCSGLLCSSDEENPARPSEDSWGRGCQQAAPPVRTHQHTHVMFGCVLKINYWLCFTEKALKSVSVPWYSGILEEWCLLDVMSAHGSTSRARATFTPCSACSAMEGFWMCVPLCFMGFFCTISDVEVLILQLKSLCMPGGEGPAVETSHGLPECCDWAELHDSDRHHAVWRQR